MHLRTEWIERLKILILKAMTTSAVARNSSLVEPKFQILSNFLFNYSCLEFRKVESLII